MIMSLYWVFLLGILATGSWRSADVPARITVDERTNEKGTKTAIVVDSDDQVQEVDWRSSSPGKPVIMANLGTRITKSGNIDLATVLPKGKVATMARRLTLADGSRIHAIIAWGFAQEPGSQSAYCSLYVLREQQRKLEKVLTKTDIGVVLEQFVFADINDDDKPLILVTTREGHSDSMLVFEIDKGSHLRIVQEIEGDYVHTIAERFMRGNPGIYVQDKASGGRCLESSRYVWSKSEGKFVKTQLPTPGK